MGSLRNRRAAWKRQTFEIPCSGWQKGGIIKREEIKTAEIQQFTLPHAEALLCPLCGTPTTQLYQLEEVETGDLWTQQEMCQPCGELTLAYYTKKSKAPCVGLAEGR